VQRVSRLRIAAAALLALSLGLPPAAVPARAAETKIEYQCPPCPQGCDEATYDHPGKCPVCGMALVAKAGGGSAPVSATPVSAPPPAPAPAPCSGPEWKQLDFWVGEWNATWPASPGSPAGTATNRIEKILDGCVVSENFAADGPAPLVGRSYSTFNPRAKKWQQTWVDNQGSYLDLDGGIENGEMTLSMDRPGPGGTARRMRMVFRNVTPDAFDWSWEASADGGKTWKVQWPIHYARKKDA